MNKRWAFFAAGYLICQAAAAQEPSDALRFSYTVPGGTARAKAIGGAMGSLGGDITATFVNPAGLGFYRTGDFVFSPQLRFGSTKAAYFGRTEQEKQNKFNWGTTGFVFGGGSNSGNMRGAAMSLAYNRTADFNNNVFYQGANNRSSFAQKYLEEVNGRNANSVAADYPFGASLALNTYYIDTFNTISQFKTLAPAGNLLQRQSLNETGGIDEFALGGAVNMDNKVMIGASIGIPVLRYQRVAQFGEADATDNPNNNFNAMVLNEDLKTTGVGINAKIGVIFKPQEAWRVGIAFHSPTLYNLTDNYYVSMQTDTEGFHGEQRQNSEDVSGAAAEFKYTLTTPYRAIASVSYVLHEVEDVSKQQGFITADLEYVNYKAASYQPNNEVVGDQSTKEYLRSVNRAIDNAYKGALNARLGGELKFTTLMVRAGVAYYGNPYQQFNGEKAHRLNLSGGLGYRNRGFFADLTYVHALNRDVHFAYRLENPADYAGAKLNQSLGNVLFTVGFKL
ncbi:porin family protein [Pseudocnuella soli]|uniref:aromatic hydrocarbon degradation protein n=1 Tax=Pseudocnuella soli TaxID=2502779 RepID=UPI00104D2BD7|nr:aromatic hydrocarbon degradation protein [Pseudocnuella soli]